MKLQYLIVIYILIMFPIYIVFSRYIDFEIDYMKKDQTYSTRLLNSTYDAIKAFQVNSINSTNYTQEVRVDIARAASETFLSSLITAFRYDGYQADVMKEYIPAIVYTMYDGYYIYAPFKNTIINEENEIDEEYANGKTLTELKPFIPYTCNYTKDDTNTNYSITYSLDNFIVVDVFDGDKHERHEGYLIDLNQFSNVESNSGKIISLKFNGIAFSNSEDGEQLKEYLLDENGDSGRFYYYTIRNGTKYYFSGTENDLNNNNLSNQFIFFIDSDGKRAKQEEYTEKNKKEFNDYFNEIKDNHLAFEYYKNAYIFTTWVKDNLQGINVSNDTNSSIKNSANYKDHEWAKIDNVFELNGGNGANNGANGGANSGVNSGANGGANSGINIEDKDSKFNMHRRDVIRAVISTNLQSAIAGFGSYTKSNVEYIMPKISETDWDLLENNICMVSFMQGFSINNRIFNNYAVVPNTFTREYVDENDIYILKQKDSPNSSDINRTYTQANEKNLKKGNIELKSFLGYEPGVLKINLKTRTMNERKYNPISYLDQQNGKYLPFLESYSSMIPNSGLKNISYSDMYKYIRAVQSTELKRAYYTALGRERQGSYKFTNY